MGSASSTSSPSASRSGNSSGPWLTMCARIDACVWGQGARRHDRQFPGCCDRELGCVNELLDPIQRWRNSGYEGARLRSELRWGRNRPSSLMATWSSSSPSPNRPPGHSGAWPPPSHFATAVGKPDATPSQWLRSPRHVVSATPPPGSGDPEKPAMIHRVSGNEVSRSIPRQTGSFKLPVRLGNKNGIFSLPEPRWIIAGFSGSPRQEGEWRRRRGEAIESTRVASSCQQAVAKCDGGGQAGAARWCLQGTGWIAGARSPSSSRAVAAPPNFA